MSSKSDGQRRGSEDVDLLDFEAKKAEIGKQLRYGLPTTLNMSKVTTTTNVFKTEEDTDEVIEVTEVTRVTVDDSVVGCGTSETRERPSRCPFDWTFGVTLTKWATFIAVIDIVKGTFGLIFAAYLAASIFRLMTETPDFEDLKRRMAHTEFVYIFAYGATGWGVVLTVCGISLWNFFLIVFGKILYDATNQRCLGKLRLWYLSTMVSLALLLVIWVRLVWAGWDCVDSNLCQWPHNKWVWVGVANLLLLSLLPTLYALAIVHSMTAIIKLTLQKIALRQCTCTCHSASAAPSPPATLSLPLNAPPCQGECHCQRTLSVRTSSGSRKGGKRARRGNSGGGREFGTWGGKENAYKNSSFQPPLPPPPPNPHWNQLSQNESPSYKQTQVILPLNYHSTLQHSYRTPHAHSSAAPPAPAHHAHAYVNHNLNNFNYNTWSAMSEKERERNRRSLNLSIQKQLEMEDEEHLAQALC